MTTKEAIKYLIAPFATSTKSYNEYLKQKEAYDLAIKVLKQRPQGEWMITGETDEFYGLVYKCTHCGKEVLACGCHNFCTWCGADMRGDKE